MLAAEDLSEMVPWILVMTKVGGSQFGGAAVTVNSNSCPGTLVLRTAEKALVVLTGSERVRGDGIRLRILMTCVLLVAASAVAWKRATPGVTSMGCQMVPLM